MKTRKFVRFVNEESLFNIPYEDKKGEWMMIIVDGCRFKTQIDGGLKLIEPFRNYIQRY